MLIHRRAPKSGTSRGPDLGHIGGHPGDAGKPQKNHRNPGPGGLFLGGSWGGYGGLPGEAIFGPKMGVFGPPRKHGFSGGPGGRKSPHLNTPRGGCSGPLDPPVPQKRWKKGPVEPFFRCFQKYPPRYAKNNSKIVGVVGGGSKTPPKIQPKNAHF
jgi:hypothetical protein